MRVLGLIGAAPGPGNAEDVSRAIAMLRVLSDSGHFVCLVVGSGLSASERTGLATAIDGAVAAPSAQPSRQPLPTIQRWVYLARLAADARGPLARTARTRCRDADVVISFDPCSHGAASTLADEIPTVMDLSHLEGIPRHGGWCRSSTERWQIQPQRSWERRVLSRAMALTTPARSVADTTFRLYYRRPTVITTPNDGDTTAAASLATTLDQVIAGALTRLADIEAGRVPSPPADPVALKVELLDVLAAQRSPRA